MTKEVNRVTEKDMEVYKDKISFWKNLSQILTDPNNGFSPDEIEDFVIFDADILNVNLSDEEICYKAKQVYESPLVFEAKDFDTYKLEIEFLKSSFPGKFDYNEETVMKIKRYRNKIKKCFFEVPQDVDDSWQDNASKIMDELCKDAEKRGLVVYW